MEPPFQRVFLIVLDSVGIGALPDADKYNDAGADTLGHIADFFAGISLPNLQELGLGNIKEIRGVHAVSHPKAHFGKMNEASVGKDTTTGHWELMGLRVQIPFRTWPDGFPDSLIRTFEQRIGRKVIGNKPASGTEIIAELGERHMKTGDVIVYTSADSVFQVAAHEEVIPLPELYHICQVARELTLDEKHSVVRVIARPFVGKPGAFVRTANRRDFSLKPPAPTVLNHLAEAGLATIGIGKISDIFAGEGVTSSVKTSSNRDGMEKLLAKMDENFHGLCFVNLVDFDALFGHRRDPRGYGLALQEFDQFLPKLLEKLRERDLLIITADHGNDPTFHGTDHTREYVPLLVYHRNIGGQGKDLMIRETFADVGATIAANFQVDKPLYGQSFLREISGT